MTRTITPRASRLSEVHDKLALAYFNKGKSPEEAMTALKSVNFIVSNVLVDGITVANILRGMYLLQSLKTAPTAKKTAKKTTCSNS